MIHATRPFVVNEWIQTKIEGYEVSGTVEVCIKFLSTQTSKKGYLHEWKRKEYDMYVYPLIASLWT
jgi:hypothetical protein